MFIFNFQSIINQLVCCHIFSLNACVCREIVVTMKYLFKFQDIIENEEINLDYLFKNSLITDLINVSIKKINFNKRISFVNKINVISGKKNRMNFKCGVFITNTKTFF